VVKQREFPAGMNPHRTNLIIGNLQKWVNGTILHYYFFNRQTDGRTVFFTDGSSEWVTWVGSENEKAVVRKAFELWKNVGIGLEFKEVDSPDEAEIRIGFERGDGAWSYLGREVREAGQDDRTMNFGWDITRDIDTAIHEIGHSLGFPHEHQNPFSGIVWDEEAVYAALAEPPNSWSREKTFHNIIRKISSDDVQGSSWDPDSIMHYPFESGLIKAPTEYRNGLQPAGGLSARDKTWAKTFYPPLTKADYAELKVLQSQELNIPAGEQKNFYITPTASRYYDIRTFGESDTVMVLFQEENGELRYRTGDDDSGVDRNAAIRVKLFKGKKYVLRIRLYYAERTGETAVMMW